MEQLQLKLQYWGISISGIAANRVEAITMISMSQPDVILSRVNSDAGDALDTLRRIKVQFPYINIIVLADDYKYHSSAIDKGASRYLLMGTSEEELINTMKGLIVSN